MVNKWDRRFLEMAELVSTWSKDPSTKCGAVIVRPDRTIASLGYNGFPRGIIDNRRLLMTREAKYQRIVHCEMNAILNYEGNVRGMTLYTYPLLPCDNCAKHVIQAGIVRCVAPISTGEVLKRWSGALKLTRSLFDEVGVDRLEVEYGR